MSARRRLLAGVAISAIPYAVGSMIGSAVALSRAVRREVGDCLEDDSLAATVSEWAKQV